MCNGDFVNFINFFKNSNLQEPIHDDHQDIIFVYSYTAESGLLYRILYIRKAIRNEFWLWILFLTN